MKLFSALATMFSSAIGCLLLPLIAVGAAFLSEAIASWTINMVGGLDSWATWKDVHIAIRLVASLLLVEIVVPAAIIIWLLSIFLPAHAFPIF